LIKKSPAGIEFLAGLFLFWGGEIVVGLRPVRAKDFVHVFLLPLQGVFSGNFHTQGVQWSLHPLRFPRFAGDGSMVFTPPSVPPFRGGRKPWAISFWPLTFPSAVDLWFRPFSLLAKVESLYDNSWAIRDNSCRNKLDKWLDFIRPFDFVFLCRDSAMCKQVCIALAAPSVLAKANIKQAWSALVA